MERHDMLRAIVSPHGTQEVLVEVPAYRIARIALRGCSKDVTEHELALFGLRFSDCRKHLHLTNSHVLLHAMLGGVAPVDTDAAGRPVSSEAEIEEGER